MHQPIFLKTCHLLILFEFYFVVHVCPSLNPHLELHCVQKIFGNKFLEKLIMISVHTAAIIACLYILGKCLIAG